MKYCIVENNVVTNVIEIGDEAIATELGAINFGDQAAIGDTVANGSIVGKTEQSDSDKMAIEVRELRNELLTATDWWGLSDHTMTAEQSAYRQALRDLPQQDGFPDNVIYPTKP